MDPSVVPQAINRCGIASLAKMQRIRTGTDIALAKRYSKTAPVNRRPLDEAYAAAMRDVARRFPGDAVIAALLPNR